MSGDCLWPYFAFTEITEEEVVNATDIPVHILTWVFSPFVKPLNLTVSTLWKGFGVPGMSLPTRVRVEASVNWKRTSRGVWAETSLKGRMVETMAAMAAAQERRRLLTERCSMMMPVSGR